MDKEIKAFKAFQATMFACEDDANRAFEKLTQNFLLLESIDKKIVTHKRYKKRGKPKKNQEPDFYEYSIESNYSFKIESYHQTLKNLYLQKMKLCKINLKFYIIIMK